MPDPNQQGPMNWADLLNQFGGAGGHQGTASNLYKDSVVITGAVTVKAIAVAENSKRFATALLK